MPKNMVAPERTQTIRRMRVAFWISKGTQEQAHAHTRMQSPTRARTHTEICNTYLYFIVYIVVGLLLTFLYFQTRLL